MGGRLGSLYTADLDRACCLVLAVATGLFCVQVKITLGTEHAKTMKAHSTDA